MAKRISNKHIKGIVMANAEPFVYEQVITDINVGLGFYWRWSNTEYNLAFCDILLQFLFNAYGYNTHCPCARTVMSDIIHNWKIEGFDSAKLLRTLDAHSMYARTNHSPYQFVADLQCGLDCFSFIPKSNI